MGTAKSDGPITEHQDCTVIYDGQCRFCVKSKEGIERLSRSKQSTTVRYIPYQSLEAELMLGSEYRPGRPDVAYLVAHDGQIRRGLDAILPLLAGITGGRLLAVFLGMPVIKPVGFWLYRFVARNRYRWFGAVDGNPR
jgi:predicted DCC family thiol-disulfide oxidoreductase YuxK